MAETSNGKIEELVAKVKEKCRITWDDEATDRYIEDELIPSACSAYQRPWSSTSRPLALSTGFS